MSKKRGLVTAGLCCCVSMFGWVRYTEAAAQTATGDHKVKVCHRADNQKYVSINVSENAVPAHLAHGDCLVDDGVRCTWDRCDRKEGCVHIPKDDRCDDDKACNGEETCDAAAGCLPGTPPCDDGVDCTVDTCTEEDEGGHDDDDGDDATAKDGHDDEPEFTCSNVPSDILCCDDNACTADSCDAATGCVNTDTSVCGDGVVCSAEKCDDGNSNACDGCSPTCALEFCGDGVVCAPEQCESNADCAVGLFCNGCLCVEEQAPECDGATCETFIPCNPGSSCQNPVCATTDAGGVCVEGTTGCAGLAPCTTTADCTGAGDLCAVGTCCGGGVCVPTSIHCEAAPTAVVPTAPVKTKGNTIAHVAD